MAPDGHMSVDHVSASHLREDLGRRAIRGGVVSLGAQGLKFALRLASVVLFARLLTPEDHGVVGMAAAVVGVAYFVKDLALSIATVQRHDMAPDQISALFWVNVLGSLVLFIVNIPLASAVAWFYDDPALETISIVLGAGFALGGLGTQHDALLRRQMRFSAVAVGEIAGLTAGLVGGVVVAALGFGYWALVAQTIIVTLATAAYAWRVCPWRPGWPRRAVGVRQLVVFGGALAVSNVLAFAVRNVDNVLVGWKWGSAELGLYKRAYSLLLVPVEQLNGPIGTVMLSTLSRLQREPRRFTAVYEKILLLTAGAGMPIVAVLFVAAADVVRLLLGPQWAGSVVMFQALAPAAWVGTTNLALGPTLVALGETRRALRWSLIAAPIQIAGFVAGLPWAGVGVAVAFSGVTLALRPIGVWYCYRSTCLTARAFYRTVALPAVASLVALAAGVCARSALATLVESRVLLAVIVPTIVIATYSVPWVAIPSKRRDIATLLGLASSALKRVPTA